MLSDVKKVNILKSFQSDTNQKNTLPTPKVKINHAKMLKELQIRIFYSDIFSQRVAF